MKHEKEITDLKRDWIIAKLMEPNSRRKASLKEVADYIATKEISKEIENAILEMDRIKQE